MNIEYQGGGGVSRAGGVPGCTGGFFFILAVKIAKKNCRCMLVCLDPCACVCVRERERERILCLYMYRHKMSDAVTRSEMWH